jgi:hypothetical protein
MILTAERPAANLYHVEVSGWDDNKAFFVENAELEWTEESGKQVTLNRGLNDGAVVFLRLLQNIGSDRSHPVAYQAECVARNSEGQWQFRLKPVSVSGRAATDCANRSAKLGDESAEMEQGSEMAVRARPRQTL